MKLLADKDERFKGLIQKIAFFILLATLGLVLNFAYTSIKKGFFTPRSSVYFVAFSGQDIKEGMPIKLSGFKIGSVKNISLDKTAQAQVEMSIDNQYLPLLNEDATVFLTKEGVIGDSILEARRGTEGKKQLKAGDKIRFERASGLDQIAQDLRDRLFPALDQINTLLRDANDPQGDVRQTMKNLREFSSSLRGTQTRLDHLLIHIETSVKTDMRPALSAVRQSMKNVESIVGKLDKETPIMLNKVTTTLDTLQKTSQTLNASMSQAAPQISGAIGDTRKIIDAASTSWPLKNMIQPPEQGVIKMDSHD